MLKMSKDEYIKNLIESSFFDKVRNMNEIETRDKEQLASVMEANGLGEWRLEADGQVMLRLGVWENASYDLNGNIITNNHIIYYNLNNVFAGYEDVEGFGNVSIQNYFRSELEEIIKNQGEEKNKQRIKFNIFLALDMLKRNNQETQSVEEAISSIQKLNFRDNNPIFTRGHNLQMDNIINGVEYLHQNKQEYLDIYREFNDKYQELKLDKLNEWIPPANGNYIAYYPMASEIIKWTDTPIVRFNYKTLPFMLNNKNKKIAVNNSNNGQKEFLKMEKENNIETNSNNNTCGSNKNSSLLSKINKELRIKENELNEVERLQNRKIALDDKAIEIQKNENDREENLSSQDRLLLMQSKLKTEKQNFKSANTKIAVSNANNNYFQYKINKNIQSIQNILNCIDGIQEDRKNIFLNQIKKLEEENQELQLKSSLESQYKETVAEQNLLREVGLNELKEKYLTTKGQIKITEEIENFNKSNLLDYFEKDGELQKAEEKAFTELDSKRSELKNQVETSWLNFQKEFNNINNIKTSESTSC